MAKLQGAVYDRPQFVRLARSWAVTDRPYSGVTATLCAKPAGAQDSSEKESQSFVLGLWGVRYQVKDVSRSLAFYTQQLGFKLDQKNLPAFAQFSIGNFKLILSGPGASG